LSSQVRRHKVYVVGKVLPGSCHVRHLCLASEDAFGAYFAGHGGYLFGEDGERVDHVIDRVGKGRDLSFRFDPKLLSKVSVCNGGNDFDNSAHLGGKVGGHEVDVIGKVFPGARDAGDLRLASELSFRAYFAGNAGNFSGERGELIDHRIDRVLELQDFAFNVYRDLLTKVSVCNGGSYERDVTHLVGKVARHEVYVVGKVLPDTGDALHLGLASELSFRTYFAGYAGNFSSKTRELIDHRIDRVFQLQDFALNVYRDLLREVSVCNSGSNKSDVTHLGSKVRRHEVDVVGKVFPDTGDALHLGLASQFSFRTYFAGNARYFGSKRGKLVDHRIDRVFQVEDFALDVYRNLLREVSVCNGGSNERDVTDLRGKVRGHKVDAVGKVLPDTGNSLHFGLASQLPFGAYFAGYAGNFSGEG